MRVLKVLLMVAAFVAIVGVGSAMAAEAEVHKSESLWELFKSTGVVGILIVLTSIAGTALSIQYGIEIREDQLAPPHLLAEIEDLINQGEIEQAAQVAAADPSYFGRIMASGLQHVGHGLEEGINSLEVKAMEAAFDLNAKISYVSLVGNLGPLIGLLGTVTGMISSFQKIEQMKAPAPKDLAVGVYESLVNTTMGLFVAIVFLVIFFIFKNKVQKLTLSINNISMDMLRRVNA